MYFENFEIGFQADSDPIKLFVFDETLSITKSCKDARRQPNVQC